MRGAEWRPARVCAGTVGLCALAAVWWVLLPVEPADAQRTQPISVNAVNERVPIPAPWPVGAAMVVERGAGQAVLPVAGGEPSQWLLVLGVSDQAGPSRTMRVHVRVRDLSRSGAPMTKAGREVVSSRPVLSARDADGGGADAIGPIGGRRGVLGLGEASPPSRRQEAGRRFRGSPLPGEDAAGAPAERLFSVMRRGGNPARPEDYERVEAHLVRAGERVEVYADAGDRELVDQELVEDLVATYDGELATRLEGLLGSIADVDGNGRLTVLLSSRLEGPGGACEPLDGCVRVEDFLPGVSAPLGNQCDLVYLNIRMQSKNHARTILAHEAAHAALLSAKIIRAGCGSTIQDEEAWLDEGIAHAVEDCLGYSRTNLEHRERAFLEAPARYRLVVPDYQAAGLYRSQGHRGATSRFLSWCAEEYGVDVLARLARSHLRGVANLEAATGARFEALFRQWTLAQAFELASSTREAAMPAGRARAVPVLRVPASEAAERVVEIEPTAFQAILLQVEPTGDAAGKWSLELQGDPDAAWQATLAPWNFPRKISETGLAMGSAAD